MQNINERKIDPKLVVWTPTPTFKPTDSLPLSLSPPFQRTVASFRAALSSHFSVSSSNATGYNGQDFSKVFEVKKESGLDVGNNVVVFTSCLRLSRILAGYSRGHTRVLICTFIIFVAIYQENNQEARVEEEEDSRDVKRGYKPIRILDVSSWLNKFPYITLSRMVAASSLKLSNNLGFNKNYGYAKIAKCTTGKRQLHFFASNELIKDAWSVCLLNRLKARKTPASFKCKAFLSRTYFVPNGGNNNNNISVLEKTALILKRTFNTAFVSLAVFKLAPAICVIVFAIWGLKPLIRLIRNIFLQDTSWNMSSTYFITSSYVQPLLLWIGTILICRALEPVILADKANHALKQQLLHFIRSLSTVTVIAYSLSRFIQQIQEFVNQTSVANDARNMGFQFVRNAVCTVAWVAAIALFMELLGFPTQKSLTAGGLGTVLLTLSGREIFTNFLSSVMIHATHPFVLNEWIQTKIEGYDVSGVVERVGWWVPTIVRGDDREAIHIPNHKFTVNIVRNLSQKTHWRIKTHLAISHLDVNKLNNIIPDMRKVLAKNPQVEQQRLHRRVFLDYLDPESQALFIMVSCFVKTSHFEEYLCVKEAVLLDLLRVISHHKVRLATPIRTIHREYTGAKPDDILSVTISKEPTHRPFLTINDSTSSRNKTKIPKESKPADNVTSNVATNNDKLTTVPSTAAKETNNDKPTTKETMEDHQGTKEEEDGKRAMVPEDNIVLDIAMDGSKRTLTIVGTTPPEKDVESKEPPTPTPVAREANAAEQAPDVRTPGDQRNKAK